MGDWSSLVSGILNFGPKQGSVLFLIGTAMLWLVYQGHLSATDVGPWWMTFLWFLAVSGGAILLVNFTIRSWQIVDHRVATRSTQEQLANAERQIEDDAIRNVEALTDGEMIAVAWLLDANMKRFSFRGPMATALHRKGIVKSVKTGSGIYEVRESVWGRRDEYLSRFRGVRLPDSFPSGYEWIV